MNGEISDILCRKNAGHSLKVLGKNPAIKEFDRTHILTQTKSAIYTFLMLCVFQPQCQQNFE